METIDLLRRMAIFARVMETGSFTLAAKRLGMGKSAVSKHVARLEAELGIRLLNRTTRSLGPTDAGSRFYERCARMLEEAEGAQRNARAQANVPSGTLRVASAVEFGLRFVVPEVKKLQDEFPDLKVTMLFDDDGIDLVERGVDVSLRLGFFKDSSLIQRRIATMRYGLFASRKYVAKHGAPTTPRRACEHPWILLTRTRNANQWVFRKAKKAYPVEAPARLTCDNTAGLVEALRHGAGVSPLLDLFVVDDVISGKLVPLLPTYTMDPEIGLFAVYPHRAFQPAKVTVFVERMQRRLDGLIAKLAQKRG